MKASDLFVRCLKAEGVEYIFGIPGEETIDLMDSLTRSSIRFVLTRHEQGAAFMADAYGRLTGAAVPLLIFVEQANLMLVHTYMAKGILPFDHPNNLFAVGGHPGRIVCFLCWKRIW